MLQILFNHQFDTGKLNTVVKPGYLLINLKMYRLLNRFFIGNFFNLFATMELTRNYCVMIYYDSKKCLKPQECFEATTFSDSACSREQFSIGFSEFKRGALKMRRPPTTVTQENVQAVVKLFVKTDDYYYTYIIN